MNRANNGQPSFCMAQALDTSMLWRETPSTEVVRKGATLAGISSSRAASEQHSAAPTLRPCVRSRIERHAMQRTTPAAGTAGRRWSAPQSGQPKSAWARVTAGGLTAGGTWREGPLTSV